MNCNHCGMDKAIRNPSGYCDHLYYPEYCDVCLKAAGGIDVLIKESELNRLKQIEEVAMEMLGAWTDLARKDPSHQCTTDKEGYADDCDRCGMDQVASRAEKVLKVDR